jgi:polysaccharide biosynthesis/export protein
MNPTRFALRRRVFAALTLVCAFPLMAVAQDRAEAPRSLQVGDRILLDVAGEPQLSDTFTVGPGPSLALPVIGDVPLEGVSAGDLEAHLTRHLSRFLRSTPQVRARLLLRLGVVGQVTRPGFYTLAGDAVLADLFTAAGGFTSEARMSHVRIERDGRRVLAGKALNDALAAGHTLTQLNLEPGDRAVVPGAGRDLESVFRIVGVLVTIPIAIYGITQIGK